MTDYRKVPPYKIKEMVSDYLETLRKDVTISILDILDNVFADVSLESLRRVETIIGNTLRQNGWVSVGRLRRSAGSREKVYSKDPAFIPMEESVEYREEDEQCCEYVDIDSPMAHTLALRIKGHILSGEIQDGESVRSIVQHHWSRLRTVKSVVLGLALLEHAGYIQVEKITPPTGRPSRVVTFLDPLKNKENDLELLQLAAKSHNLSMSKYCKETLGVCDGTYRLWVRNRRVSLNFISKIREDAHKAPQMKDPKDSEDSIVRDGSTVLDSDFDLLCKAANSFGMIMSSYVTHKLGLSRHEFDLWKKGQPIPPVYMRTIREHAKAIKTIQDFAQEEVGETKKPQREVAANPVNQRFRVVSTDDGIIKIVPVIDRPKKAVLVVPPELIGQYSMYQKGSKPHASTRV